jgi:type I restriction enzyme S subunit
MLVPKLRFKREDGTEYPEWRHTCVGEVFDKVKDKNKGCSSTNVVTNSAEFGLISQRNFFDKDIAVEGKTDNYTIIKTNDFVYNPRKSSFAPFGAFNGYTLTDDGIVSPLYFCLRMKNNEMSANFMLWYFKSSRWHRFIYENGEQGGARHDRVGVSEEMLKGIPIDKPCLEEQQKIADFLSAYDEAISYAKQELDKWKELKKGLLQQMFV